MENESKLPGKHCGVSEVIFPLMGKCCRRCDAAFGACEKICSYCQISASLPCGERLRKMVIFECALFGYGKRVTE